MTAVLEPREVDRPFIGRWLRSTVLLFLHSPMRFGIVIAVLGGLDTFISSTAHELAFPKPWADRAGLLLLPIVWLVVAALARGADVQGQTWSALAALGRRRLWRSVGIGVAILIAIAIVVQGALGGLTLLGAPTSRPMLWHSGQLIGALTVNVMIVVAAFEPCYFPLLVLAGADLSHSDARHLSRRAAELNGRILVWLLFCIGVITADALEESFRAFGMIESAFLVAAGIFNYVAYRDIFERQTENVPKRVAWMIPARYRNPPLHPSASLPAGAVHVEGFDYAVRRLPHRRAQSGARVPRHGVLRQQGVAAAWIHRRVRGAHTLTQAARRASS